MTEGHQITLDIHFGVLDAVANPCLSRQMTDLVEGVFLKQVFYRSRISQFNLDEFKVGIAF